MISGVLVLFLRLLLAGFLYAFLGWAFYTIWNDMRQQEYTIRKKALPPIFLIPQSGKVAHNFEFTQPEVTIGRSSGNDCVLFNDTVSNYHARLYYRQKQWWIEDLDSTNGSFLNGQPISFPVVLTTGDLLGFGQVNFVISISSDAQQKVVDKELQA